MNIPIPKFLIEFFDLMGYKELQFVINNEDSKYYLTYANFYAGKFPSLKKMYWFAIKKKNSEWTFDTIHIEVDDALNIKTEDDTLKYMLPQITDTFVQGVNTNLLVKKIPTDILEWDIERTISKC